MVQVDRQAKCLGARRWLAVLIFVLVLKFGDRRYWVARFWAVPGILDGNGTFGSVLRALSKQSGVMKCH
ncbi:hypothetical protein CASFOL_028768 [Castilleja foliolosa]|uniref:Uncharacterized protein n=1 Tax=Castilleja foliolosa TaxID=1961234 RepID=A0ABD3CC29_9LAMI